MGLATALLFGGLLAGGYAATRRRGKNTNLPAPGPTSSLLSGARPRGDKPIIGKAISREEYARRQAAGAVDATGPPDAVGNVADAYGMAARTRRRARAGSAGRVKLPGVAGASNSGAPRTLLGY